LHETKASYGEEHDHTILNIYLVISSNRGWKAAQSTDIAKFSTTCRNSVSGAASIGFIV